MMNPMNQIGGRGWDQNYYDNNYQRNECMFGCPANSHCEWGFCECNAGTSRFFKTFHTINFPLIVFDWLCTRRFGQCQSDWSRVPNYAPRPPTFDPFKVKILWKKLGKHLDPQILSGHCDCHDLQLSKNISKGFNIFENSRL